MNIEGRTGYAQNAFLGEKVHNPDLVKKIDEVAEKVNDILNPIDDMAKRRVLGDSIKLIRGLGIQVDNVKTLNETLNDRNKTLVQKENAEEVLDTLAKGVYVAMRYGENEEIRADLCSGSVEKINERLPEPLKGLGERVRANIIDEPKIIKVLDGLDKKRVRFEKAGEMGKQQLREEISSSIGQLGGLTIDSTKEDQLGMVMEFLGVEGDRLGFGVGVVDGEGSVAGGRRGSYDGKVYGSPEGMDRVAPIPIPADALSEIEGRKLDKDSAKAWMVMTLVRMSENPLFFANWWQQGTADQITSMITNKLRFSSYSKEFPEIRDYSYAIISVLGMQAVDRNADANSDSYGQFAPPKNMSAVLHWDDGGKNYETLKSDKQIRSTLETIFDTAFDKKNGWKIVKAFSDGSTYDSQNEYLKKIFNIDDEKQLSLEQETMMAKGRISMAMFEVDWMPEWIRWANENRRADVYSENDDPSENISWLVGGFSQKEDETWAKYSYTTTLESKHGNEAFEIGYNHPRVLRPWDVAAGAKGSYRNRPQIIWGMENVLKPFMDTRLATKDGRWVRLSGLGISPNKGTASVTDRYLKYGKFIFELMGGPSGPELDNLTTLDKIEPLAANFYGPGSSGSEEYGKFIADLFALKADAMFFPGYKSNADLTLSAIAGLDTFSGEMEKKKALEGALGPNGNFAHGWVAEIKRLRSIDLLEIMPDGTAKYPQFYNAFVRVFMDTPDIEEARRTYRKAAKILGQNQTVGVVSGVFGILKTITGSK